MTSRIDDLIFCIIRKTHKLSHDSGFRVYKRLSLVRALEQPVMGAEQYGASAGNPKKSMDVTVGSIFYNTHIFCLGKSRNWSDSLLQKNNPKSSDDNHKRCDDSYIYF